MEIKAGSQVIQVKNPDKILYPEDKITKLQVIRYYERIAPLMLPYLKDRPLTMHRFPDGINVEGFFQKEVPEYFPQWIEKTRLDNKTGGDTTYLLCQNKETLLYIAEQACITPHVWLARYDKPNHPDKIVFDLDPAKPEDFESVRETALLIKEKLDRLELNTFIMTTGSKGVHIIIPIEREYPFEQTRLFAQKLAKQIAKNKPDKITVEQRKEKRKNRLFIDTTRNAYAQTSVAPYSLRAKKGAPIATPISWSQLEDENLNAKTYNINNIFKYLDAQKNPWDKIENQVNNLKEAFNKL
ncbi:MAG: non-homologous end-joining DNA ligase [Candidatus Odinarchaeum yellowstonii]|uniref:Non-homologous end-joining DNA ligase n=1 Tax=Odinarchaeota yellowstonii (strain LCB_4) TaxID=1841599 RepID=A0AAF0D1Q7_ODILC|nr:MAG: non-homologous end-joining DNA ligase [Candidatus Odinarchaeum yellowstonii]